MSLSLSPSLVQSSAQTQSGGVLDISSGVSDVVAYLEPSNLAPSVTEALAELTVSPRMEAIGELVRRDPRELAALNALVSEMVPFSVMVTAFDPLNRPMDVDTFIADTIFESRVGAIQTERTGSIAVAA
jgi:hypothetical protein